MHHFYISIVFVVVTSCSEIKSCFSFFTFFQIVTILIKWRESWQINRLQNGSTVAGLDQLSHCGAKAPVLPPLTRRPCSPAGCSPAAEPPRAQEPPPPLHLCVHGPPALLASAKPTVYSLAAGAWGSVRGSRSSRTLWSITKTMEPYGEQKDLLLAFSNSAAHYVRQRRQRQRRRRRSLEGDIFLHNNGRQRQSHLIPISSHYCRDNEEGLRFMAWEQWPSLVNTLATARGDIMVRLDVHQINIMSKGGRSLDLWILLVLWTLSDILNFNLETMP